MHRERHSIERIGWLRAAVLGANDGTVSVAGLLVGVAAGGAGSQALLAAGIAGTVAGAMSMAAGEYVSVQTQADVENADLEQERRELERHPDGELDELARIYQARGLEPALARRVAQQLTAHDALASHARDELGITEDLRARPQQAAATARARPQPAHDGRRRLTRPPRPPRRRAAIMPGANPHATSHVP